MVKKKHSNDIMSAREVLERMAEIEGFSPFEFYSNGKPDINKILYKRKSNRIKTVTIEKGGKVINFEMFGDFTGYVYIINSGNGLYKIGYSKDVQKRFSYLNMASPYKIEMAYTSHFVSDGRKLEKILHKTFQKKHKKGEWFELSSADLQKAKRIIDGFK